MSVVMNDPLLDMPVDVLFSEESIDKGRQLAKMNKVMSWEWGDLALEVAPVRNEEHGTIHAYQIKSGTRWRAYYYDNRVAGDDSSRSRHRISKGQFYRYEDAEAWLAQNGRTVGGEHTYTGSVSLKGSNLPSMMMTCPMRARWCLTDTSPFGGPRIVGIRQLDILHIGH
jgi:hypothetical protein